VSVFVRAATLADIRRMAELIAATAHPISTRELADWMDGDSAWSAWHVAEDDRGDLVGLQWVGPREDLPREACDIATFVAETKDRLAIGARLFDTTAEVARLLGYDWINASVPDGNDGALIYYQSRGFRVWEHSGTQQRMRYDLD